MSNELLVTLIRVGYLALLWLMVIACLSVLRRDIFGTMVTPRGRGRGAATRRRAAVAPANAAEAPPLPGAATFPKSDGKAPLRLIVMSGPLAGTSLPLDNSPIVIGRSPTSTLALRDDYASSQHARLFPNQQGWWLEDLGSRNGTFVDDERLVEARPVHEGVQFRIGSTTLQIGR
ncbi:FHA domain-containing protein FhaB/FipA [Boudabousia marimammalium]|uniref:FHA domain-containing protein n=1 Tax=Boudabousia marimammalium TaxID=156892 RepID=A0A1Q5PSI1_9ACTO|nr:FHA domain-containing protein [Boudabousia marimammalium]OKL50544.1 hypothetical protein BM477_00820 [Boudabousia marimammalium]